MKYILKAGIAGESLSVAVSALNSINDLIQGEKAPLKTAPHEIKEKAGKIVEDLKELIDLLNKQVASKDQPV